jgi:hypothetical protein
MGTTASGLPYPEPTAPVRDGALAIRQLAEAIDPRANLKSFAGSGGYTTNEFGGVALNVPFQTITFGMANPQATAYGYSWNRDSRAPAGLVWFQFCDVVNKAAMPNVFAVMDYIVEGY